MSFPAFQLSRFLALCLTFVIFTSCSRSPVVAEVGKEKITLEEFEAELKGAKRQGDTAEEKMNRLEYLIGDELLAQEAVRRGLDDDIEVQVKIDGYRRRVLAQALRDQVLKEGIDERVIREYYQNHRDEFTREVINVAHILVRIPYEPTEAQRIEAERKIEEALLKIRQGQPFEEVVKKYSDDRATRENDGRLGELNKGQVDPEFYQRAVELKAGEVSGPVKTRFGYHLIKALDGSRTVVSDYDRVKAKIRQDLRQTLMSDLQQKLRKEMKVQINEEMLENSK